jgi:DNA-binding NarL/FixJ family response regulator
MMTIRTLLADDEAMVRAGVCAILSTDPEIEVVAEAEDGREAIDLVQRLRPDVAVLDVRMPNLDGLAAMAEILRTVPETAVMILTVFGDDASITGALDGGASGFVLKAGDPRELVTGIRAVAEGGAYLSPTIAHRVLTGPGGRIWRPDVSVHEGVAALTEPERTVLGLLGTGMSNAEIARQLYMVEGVVQTHINEILTRLGIEHRGQAALAAFQAGLVDEAL